VSITASSSARLISNTSSRFFPSTWPLQEMNPLWGGELTARHIMHILTAEPPVGRAPAPNAGLQENGVRKKLAR
jgi:hypothetical protein